MSHGCEFHCIVVWTENVGGGRLGRLEFCECLGTGGSKHGYAMGDAA
jgi:hypothetical protein